MRLQGSSCCVLRAAPPARTHLHGGRPLPQHQERRLALAAGVVQARTHQHLHAVARMRGPGGAGTALLGVFVRPRQAEGCLSASASRRGVGSSMRASRDVLWGPWGAGSAALLTWAVEQPPSAAAGGPSADSAPILRHTTYPPPPPSPPAPEATGHLLPGHGGVQVLHIVPRAAADGLALHHRVVAVAVLEGVLGVGLRHHRGLYAALHLGLHACITSRRPHTTEGGAAESRHDVMRVERVRPRWCHARACTRATRSGSAVRCLWAPPLPTPRPAAAPPLQRPQPSQGGGDSRDSRGPGTGSLDCIRLRGTDVHDHRHAFLGLHAALQGPRARAGQLLSAPNVQPTSSTPRWRGPPWKAGVAGRAPDVVGYNSRLLLARLLIPPILPVRSVHSITLPSVTVSHTRNPLSPPFSSCRPSLHRQGLRWRPGWLASPAGKHQRRLPC